MTKRRLARAARVTALGFALSLGVLFAACQDEDGAASTDSKGAATDSTPAVPAVTATGVTSSNTGPDDVESDVEAALAAQTDGDVEEFLKYWTPEGLKVEFDATPEELRQAGPDDLSTKLEAKAFRGTQVTGSQATTEVDIEAEGSYVFGRRLQLTRQGDVWKISNSEPSSVAVPTGATTVPIEMTEFQFIFKPSDFDTSKPIAFELRNVGGQEHEMVLFKLDDDVNLEQALQSEEEPEGLEFIAAERAKPGASFTIVTTDSLDAGRYGMVCFFPDTSDPEGTPHAFKGMVSDFRIE